MKKIFFLLGIVILVSCKRDHSDEPDPTPASGLTASTPVMGYNMLTKIRGLWNGSLYSSTALGSFPEWIVDLRPISASQIASKSELDSVNDIFLSFFIVKYGNDYRLAFRNGGGFAGMQRVSYQICDSVSEGGGTSFYRFSDFKMGTARAYATFLFDNDSLHMKVYTNHYNTVSPADLHIAWDAKLQDSTLSDTAAAHFGYPQKVLVKDLSSTFNSMSESIYYGTAGDPYPDADQPYVGTTTVNITYSGSLTIAPGTKTFILFTTQPLFSGITYLPANLKYRTRYVILSCTDLQYVFTLMHPGTYYAYVMHDADGNGTMNTGDHINSPLSQISFTLSAEGSQTVNATVNFTVP